jgi:17beta-estradiol 17-dehydrogenase / very-long-chain 3-oxoacyl-CoA reductase
MNVILSKTGEKFFQYFGLAVFSYVLLKYLVKIAKNLYVFTLGGINIKKYGEWAVVTGCTDGIGKAYAEKLAKKGLNIVLLSRSLDKLNEFSSQLIEKYKVETKIIAADFTGKYFEIKFNLNA